MKEPGWVFHAQQGKQALVTQVTSEVIFACELVQATVDIGYHLVEPIVFPHCFQVVQDHSCVEALKSVKICG